jgi:hypothetical protein
MQWILTILSRIAPKLAVAIARRAFTRGRARHIRLTKKDLIHRWGEHATTTPNELDDIFHTFTDEAFGFGFERAAKQKVAELYTYLSRIKVNIETQPMTDGQVREAMAGIKDASQVVRETIRILDGTA